MEWNESCCYLTLGLLGASLRTPCSWMLLMWWQLAKLPLLQLMITDDSKKNARLCCNRLSWPQLSRSVSSQLTFRFLTGEKNINNNDLIREIM